MVKRRMSASQRRYFGGGRRRASRRSSGGRSFFKRGRSKGGSDNLMDIAIGGAGYGALRQPAWNFIGKYVPQFAGQWTDEAVMLGASYLLAKHTSGIPRSVGRAGMYVETARIGAGLASGVTGTTTNAGTTGTVYG